MSKRPIGRERRGTATLLADQLVAWRAHRAGDSVTQIATYLHRTPLEAREILWGRNER